MCVVLLTFIGRHQWTVRTRGWEWRVSVVGIVGRVNSARSLGKGWDLCHGISESYGPLIVFVSCFSIPVFALAFLHCTRGMSALDWSDLSCSCLIKPHMFSSGFSLWQRTKEKREKKKRRENKLLDPLAGQATVIVHCFLYASIFKSFVEQWRSWFCQVFAVATKTKTKHMWGWKQNTFETTTWGNEVWSWS